MPRISGTIRSRRDYYFRPGPINGVLRVACIGDSMMHGAGIWHEQAFPAHLSHQLNAVFPGSLIETINYGLCGANIWNSWALFKANWTVEHCDAVVLSVCENDIRTLESWYGGYDPAQDDDSWGAPGLGNSLLTRLLDTMDEFIATTGLPVILFYYDLRPIPEAQAKTLDGIFAARRFNFLNTASALRAEFDALTIEELTISPADGHPSSRVHEIVARCLSRLISRSEEFASLSVRCPPDSVPSAIIAAVNSMIEAGYDVNAALDWGIATLASKERVLRRIVSFDGLPSVDTAVAAARAALDARMALWTHMMVQPLRLMSLRESLSGFDEEVQFLEWHLYCVEELVQAIGLAENDPLLLGEIRKLLLASEWVREHPPQDLACLSNWRDRLAELEGSLADTLAQVFEPPCRSKAGPLAVLAANELDQWHRALRPLFDVIKNFIPRLGRQLQATKQLKLTGTDTGLISLTRDRFVYALACLENQVSGLKAIRREWEGAYDSLYTQVDVTLGVKCPGETVALEIRLIVCTQYRVPTRTFLCQEQNIALTKGIEVYSFHFPLLVQGDIEIELKNHQPDKGTLAARQISLECVTIFNMRQSPTGPKRVERSFYGPQPDFTLARIPGISLS